MSLSQEAKTYADSKGKFHDSKEKADHASFQYMLDTANPGGSLSVQALATMLAGNPEAYKLLQDDVAQKVKDKESGESTVGNTGLANDDVKPHQPSRRHNS